MPTRSRRALHATLLVCASTIALPGCPVLWPSEHPYYEGQRTHPSEVRSPEPAALESAWTGDGGSRPRRPQNVGVIARRPRGRFRALLIGINDYSDSAGYADDLSTPAEDVRRLGKLLEDSYGFDEVEMLIDDSATRRGILSALRRLHSTGTRDDNVLVYYAGHGILRDDGAGAWVAADAEFEEDAIPNAEIKDRISRLPARRVLMISDSCFSGSFLIKRSAGAKQPALVEQEGVSRGISTALVRDLNASREVISSGNLSPVPDEGLGFCRGTSPFACQLLTALEKGPAGGVLSTTDLFVDVYYHLQRRAIGRQRPQRGTIEGHAGGEFYFVKLAR